MKFRYIAAPLVVALLASCGTGKSTPVNTTATASPGVPVSTIVFASQEHTTADVEYPHTPPIGGDHHPGWQNCGVYRQAIIDENAVHSLEHGAVWLTYRPSIASADIAKLEQLAKNQTHVLVSPHESQSATIVASAWGAQQSFDAFTADIATFVRTFQQGPQTPEPGAVCNRGIGQPQ